MEGPEAAATVYHDVAPVPVTEQRGPEGGGPPLLEDVVRPEALKVSELDVRQDPVEFVLVPAGRQRVVVVDDQVPVVDLRPVHELLRVAEVVRATPTERLVDT